MPLIFPTKPSFASGRLSSRMFGRIDLDQYVSGLEDCTNFIVFPHGGATFRPGTAFVDEVKDSTDPVRLIPFVFSRTEGYVLEFGPEYVRIFFDHARLTTTPAELVTPYNTDDVDALRYTQSGDVLFAVIRTRPPREFRRTGVDTWETVAFDYRDGPYLDVNATGTTLTPSATTGAITITASAVAGINGGDGFLSTDVGRLIRILYSGAWGYARVTAVNSTTQVAATVLRAFGATTATNSWRLGAWSDTTGWPEVVHFHQQRLWFGRGQFLWGSHTGDFNNFSPDTDGDDEVTDSTAVTYRLGEGRIDQIEWLQSSRVLEVGTGGMEFAFLGGAGPDSALTPDSVKARKETERGSFDFGQPVFSSNGTVFLNRAGRKLFNFYYSFQQDGYIADDLTTLSEDITYPFCFETSYQAEPDMLLWAVRADGTLISCTFNPTQNVVAWHEHAIGGSFDGGSAVVESICTIPSPDGTFDELWLVVLRTIDGVTERYIEYLTPAFRPIDDIEEAFFVDCGGTYDGAPTTTITGLDYLEGEEVAILADGALRPRQVVESGEITFAGPAASIVHVGLPYSGRLTLLPFEPGDLAEALTANRSRIVEIGLLFYRTVLAKVGILGKTLEVVGRRLTTDNLGEPLPPRTDFQRVPVESNSEYRNRIVVEQDEPLPCTILSVQPVVDR